MCCRSTKMVSGTGGIIFGDLPPYEAFPIGGTNSVRGYSEGGVGSGRSYVAGTAELHYPIYGPVEVKAGLSQTRSLLVAKMHILVMAQDLMNALAIAGTPWPMTPLLSHNLLQC